MSRINLLIYTHIFNPYFLVCKSFVSIFRGMQESKEFKTDWRSIWIANIVAFIGSVQSSSLVPSVWPYLKKVDIRTTETLYGFVRGLYSLFQIIFAIISGYFSNKIENTK